MSGFIDQYGNEQTSALFAGATGVVPANTTTVLGDNVVAFGVPVRSYFVQNNTGAAIYVNEDAVATQGSIAVAAGSYFQRDYPVTNLHLYAAAGVSVNGTTAGGVVVRGVY